jgi:tripartite-type tricarboxylate transporter receptor subunit TctC
MTAPSCSNRRSWLKAAAASFVATPGLSARAQSSPFPNKPLTLVVGYPPGGSTDFTARVVSEELARRLGQPVVVDNVGGAGGTLGAQRVAGAAADGYTLLVGTNNEMAIHALINKKARVDGVADFTPVGLIGAQPMVLVAGPELGVKTIDQFIDKTRRNPGKFSYGSSGVGTALHLAGEMVKERAKIFMVHIPYRGVAPLLADVVGGRLEYGVFVMSSALPHIKAGKLVAIGSTQLARSAAAPEVPALGGHPQLKGLDIASWFGLFGPAKMPTPVVARLQTALRETLQTPQVRTKLEDAGATLAEPGADLGGFMRDEIKKYRQIVAFANIQE